MNQIKIGNYITKKRKEKNYTQQELADKLNISSKTVSKWECGKSLPDYGIVEILCNELDVSINELFSGEDNVKNDKQMIEMLERIQVLENQKKIIFGMLLVILGIASAIMSELFGGSNFKEFISGFLLGLAIVEMIVGIYITSRNFIKQ